MESSVLVGAANWDRATKGARTQGLYRLDQEAGAWHALTNGLPDNAEVRAIARRDSDTIYVGTQEGPYRSADGGHNWQSLNLPLNISGPDRVVWSILAVPPSTLLVGAQGTTVFRSDDDGESWRKLPVPTPGGHIEMGFPARVIRMAVDPSNSDEIYIAFEVGGLVRSLDGGETWTDCSAGLLELAAQDHLQSGLVSKLPTEGMVDCHAITMSPAQPGTVFLANRMGLFRGADKGTRWQEMGIGRFSELTYARDVKAYPHDPDTLFAAFSDEAAGRQGSLYRSTDLGESWTRYDHDVAVNSTMMSIAPSVETPDRFYCATRRGQAFGTEDAGKSWQAFPLPDGVEGVYAINCA